MSTSKVSCVESFTDNLCLPMPGLTGAHTAPETVWKRTSGSLASINRKENIIFFIIIFFNNPNAGFFHVSLLVSDFS